MMPWRRFLGWALVSIVAILAMHMVDPPAWLRDWSFSFIVHIAPWVYWLLFVVHFLVWAVLSWQRPKVETPVATRFRQFIFTKAMLWLALAVGRTILDEWQTVGYVVVTVLVCVYASLVLYELAVSYVVPAWRSSRDGVDAPVVSPVDQLVLPRKDATLPDKEENDVILGT